MATGSVVLIDGEPGEGQISVFDDAFLRGDGCFEAIRSYEGRPFAWDEHYQRLTASAGALGISVPPTSDLLGWVDEVAAAGGDCIVRVVLTRGGTVPGQGSPSRCVVMWHPVPQVPAALSLLPVVAPWHPAGRPWDLSGVKTTSYAPNQAAGRLARQQGHDEALLLSDSEMVLEGPTFSFAWVVDGVVETAGLEMGILDSITRRFVMADCHAIGIEARQGRFGLARLEEATEAFAISTVKQIVPVTRVGDMTYSAGEVAAALREALSVRVHASAPQFTTGR